MAFITDKEQLKSGLIICGRGEVAHRDFYCRIRLAKKDRYKTISLRTSDRQTARDQAFDLDAEVRFKLKHDVRVFNRPFRDVAEEYITTIERRANNGVVSVHRAKCLKNWVRRALDDYVGSTQVDLIGQDRWAQYPTWRRENGKGRHCAPISDSTIAREMGAFNAVMNYAISKRHVPASHRFEGKPKLKTMRRDAFTAEEHRKLHSVGRKWIKEATTPQGIWYRTMCYNFILIMCDTGMRPPGAKNLRWKDVAAAKDRDGREIVVLFVQGKGKSRNLVAPKALAIILSGCAIFPKSPSPTTLYSPSSTASPPNISIATLCRRCWRRPGYARDRMAPRVQPIASGTPMRPSALATALMSISSPTKWARRLR